VRLCHRPAYPEKLIRIIEENRLYEFDNANVLPKVSVSSGEDKILKFQKLCNSLGITDYEGKALAEDNKLGPITKKCVMEYQRSKNIEAARLSILLSILIKR
jgi:hypothetical protein